MPRQAECAEKVLELLDGRPEGMSISAISRELKLHRNSVSGYLNMMHLEGQVDLYYNGREKLYMRSCRVPYNALRHIDSYYLAGLNKDLNFIDINEPFLELLGLPREEIISNNIRTMPFSPFHDPRILRSIEAALEGKEYSGLIEAPSDRNRPYLKLKCIPTIFDNKRIGVALLIDENLGGKDLEEHAGLMNERYRVLFEDQEEYLARFLPDGTILYINEAYCRALKLSRDDIIGTKFRPIVPEGDKTSLKKHFSSLTEDDPVAVIEHRSILPDGSIHWHHWKDRAIFKDGEVVEYHSVGQDISRYKAKEESCVEILHILNQRVEEKNEEWRKINQELCSEILKREKIEAALKESESRYRAIVEGQLELITRWKPDGTLTFVNDAICNYLGIPRQKLLGRNFQDFLMEEDRHRVNKNIGMVSPAHPHKVIRLRTVLQTGEIRWQEWSIGAIFDHDGDLIELQSIGRDITDMIYIEKNGQEHKNNSRSLPEGIKDAIVCLDNNACFTYISPTVGQILGYDPDELLGKASNDFFHRDDKTKGFEAFTTAFKGNPNTVECRVMHKSGSFKWMRAFSFPTITNGQITGITSIIGETIDWKSEVEMLMSSFQATLDALPHGILIVDKTGKPVFHNQKFAQIWQIPASILELNDLDSILDFTLNQLVNRDELGYRRGKFASAPGPDNPGILKFKDGRMTEWYSHPQVIEDRIVGNVLCFRELSCAD